MVKPKRLIRKALSRLGIEVQPQPKISELDLSKVELIRSANADELKDIHFVENLLLKLGLNNESLTQFPEALYQYTGYGLFSWQYPNQFSQLLVTLSKYPIRSYLEIGSRHGGSFIILNEYLRKMNPNFDRAIAMDRFHSDSLSEYAKSTSGTEYLVCSSRSDRFREFVTKLSLDLVFIDGDHSLHGCKSDFELVREHAKMLIFHDISSVACPGVCTVWQHFKSIYQSQYDFFEFTDQYEEVYQKSGNSFLGIGLAVKKD